MKNLYLGILAVCLLLNFTSQAHFTTRGGPLGGPVASFAVNPGLNLLYLTSPTGGVYYGTTSTFTGWTYINYGNLSNPNVSSLTFIGNSANNKVIAGTPDGVFVSGNKGVTWTSTTTGLAKPVTALTTIGQFILAGTNGSGVYISSDSAKTFSTSTTATGLRFITSFAVDGSDVYASTSDNGVFKSSDNGTTWSAINTSLTGTGLNVKSIVVINGNLLAGTPGGVYSTPTNSISWSSTVLNSTSINGFAVSGNTVYAATQNGVYVSTDNGATWNAATTGYSGPVTAIAAYNNSLYLGTPNDGVYKSSSTTTINWTLFNTGYNNQKAYTVYNAGNLVVATTEKGVYVSTNLSTAYSRRNNGLTDSLNVKTIAAAGSRLFAGTDFAGVFVTNDSGKTWTAANAGLPSQAVKVLIASNEYIYAALANGQVYSSNLGSNPLAWNLTSGLGANFNLSSFATDGINTFLGTLGNGVYITLNGKNWFPYNNGLTPQSITGLAVNATYVYASTPDAGVWRSSSVTCAGWVNFSNGLPTTRITALASGGKWIAAAYKGGVYALVNGNSTWVAPDVIDYIPRYSDINNISWTAENTGRIFISTPFNSMYSNGNGELPEFSTISGGNLQSRNTLSNSCSVYLSLEEERISATSVTLSPNPSTGDVRITFDTEQVEAYQMDVFSAMGQKVGQYEGISGQSVSLRLPAGWYTLRLTANKKVAFKALVIE